MKSREVRKRLNRVISILVMITMMIGLMPLSPRDWSFAVPVGEI